MSTTRLTYDIVPDKSPLYTTVDQLNQSTADLQVTAQNSGAEPVTVSKILIELIKVIQGADTVQLVRPDSAGSIQFPNNVTGPGQATWTVTTPYDGQDGQFLFEADGGGATFQAGDTLSFTLQSVVIREGVTGTALVPIIEASRAGRGETDVGIAITQSTLDVHLLVPNDQLLIEPNGVATLRWHTTDATSGLLILPGNSLSSITLDPQTNLVQGQQQVSPIVDTTYSLSCEGRGPSVTSKVTVSVDSLQMGQIEVSTEKVHVGGEALLRWHTNADSCTLDDGGGNPVSVPPTVPNTQYPDGYPVNPRTPTTYTLQGTKQLGNGQFVEAPITNTVYVYPVQITSFNTPDLAFDASGDHLMLAWQTVDAISCALSTQGGTGSVNVPVGFACCFVGATPDGRTLIVYSAPPAEQELGRLTLPTSFPESVTFILSAAGVNPQQMTCSALFGP